MSACADASNERPSRDGRLSPGCVRLARNESGLRSKALMICVSQWTKKQCHTDEEDRKIADARREDVDRVELPRRREQTDRRQDEQRGDVHCSMSGARLVGHARGGL